MTGGPRGRPFEPEKSGNPSGDAALLGLPAVAVVARRNTLLVHRRVNAPSHIGVNRVLHHLRRLFDGLGLLARFG